MSVIVRSIVAVAKNGVIGNGGELPWPRLKGDMKYFKEVTLGSPVIMGAKTWESLPEALSGRINIVVSRKLTQNSMVNGNVFVFNNYEDALKYAKLVTSTNYVYVIGGKQIYETADQCGVDEYLVTHIGSEFKGDTFYNPPVFGLSDYQVSTFTEVENGIPVIFKHYKKVTPPFSSHIRKLLNETGVTVKELTKLFENPILASAVILGKQPTLQEELVFLQNFIDQYGEIELNKHFTIDLAKRHQLRPKRDLVLTERSKLLDGINKHIRDLDEHTVLAMVNMLDFDLKTKVFTK